MKTTVAMFDGMGRGVMATSPIPQGNVVMICELLVLDQHDTRMVNMTELQHYTFKFNESQDCLVLGLGEIFNHSDTPSVSYKLIDKDGRKMMAFTALRTIFAGEQLFIDYNADTKVDVSSYIAAKSMVE